MTNKENMYETAFTMDTSSIKYGFGVTREVGYDIDKLVEGALPQERVTKLSPRPADGEGLKQLFLESLTCW